MGSNDLFTLTRSNVCPIDLVATFVVVVAWHAVTWLLVRFNCECHNQIPNREKWAVRVQAEEHRPIWATHKHNSLCWSVLVEWVSQSWPGWRNLFFYEWVLWRAVQPDQTPIHQMQKLMLVQSGQQGHLHGHRTAQHFQVNVCLCRVWLQVLLMGVRVDHRSLVAGNDTFRLNRYALRILCHSFVGRTWTLWVGGRPLMLTTWWTVMDRKWSEQKRGAGVKGGQKAGRGYLIVASYGSGQFSKSLLPHFIRIATRLGIAACSDPHRFAGHFGRPWLLSLVCDIGTCSNLLNCNKLADQCRSEPSHHTLVISPVQCVCPCQSAAYLQLQSCFMATR